MWCFKKIQKLPWSSMASPTTLLYPSWSAVPILFISILKLSYLLFFGLPHALLPPGFSKLTTLKSIPSYLSSMCPAHLNFSDLTSPTLLLSLFLLYVCIFIALLCFFHHTLRSLCLEQIFFFISNFFCCSFMINSHVSENIV